MTKSAIKEVIADLKYRRKAVLEFSSYKELLERRKNYHDLTADEDYTLDLYQGELQAFDFLLCSYEEMLEEKVKSKK